jgi:hypothetical protein
MKLHNGLLTEVNIPPLPRPFFLLRHEERYRSKAADAFDAMISADAFLSWLSEISASASCCGTGQAPRHIRHQLIDSQPGSESFQTGNFAA